MNINLAKSISLIAVAYIFFVHTLDASEESTHTHTVKNILYNQMPSESVAFDTTGYWYTNCQRCDYGTHCDRCNNILLLYKRPAHKDNPELARVQFPNKDRNTLCCGKLWGSCTRTHYFEYSEPSKGILTVKMVGDHGRYAVLQLVSRLTSETKKDT